VEIDYRPRCDDGPVPAVVQNWYHHLEDATTRGSKPIALMSHTRQLLHAQGFVDINELVVPLPLNSWPADPHGTEVGRWHNVGMVDGLEALSLGPFTRCFLWPASDVRRFCKEVATAISNKQNHLYQNL
jgi:hypothetical protein